MVAIGEAARRSGVGAETIRYYERAGIIAPPRRTPSGQRDFTEAEIADLRFIRRCRELGFAMADISVLRSLEARSGRACGDVLAVAGRHLDAVRGRMAELRALESELAALIAGCTDAAGPCAALETLRETPQRAENGTEPNSATAAGTGAMASAVTATNRAGE